MQKPAIDYNSDEAARPYTASGWVSSTGRFFMDESSARYDGCTHRDCQTCGKPVEKSWLVCSECRTKKREEQYQSMPFKEWDGEPVVIHDGDEYFFDEETFLDWCDDNELDPENVSLVICEPKYATEIDPNDLFQDDLVEDCTFEDVADQAVLNAFSALNKAIRESKSVLSWWPGKFRTNYRKPDAI